MTKKTRFRPATIPMALLGGAVIAAGVGFAVETPAQSTYMSVKEVKPGMKGYGLTVFSGHEPTKFGVEVISTLNNFQPNQDLFIVKTDHPRLDVAHTVAGMSGSPIYIDGKMIGAYAYGWLFGVEPIAGVTPIQNMLDDLKRPVPKELIPGLRSSLLPNPQGKGAKTAKLGKLRKRYGKNLPRTTSHRFRGKDVANYSLRTHAAQVANHASPSLQAPTGMGLRAASTDIMAGGLSPRGLKLAQELLEPSGMNVLQTGGGGQMLEADLPHGQPRLHQVLHHEIRQIAVVLAERMSQRGRHGGLQCPLRRFGHRAGVPFPAEPCQRADGEVAQSREVPRRAGERHHWRFLERATGRDEAIVICRHDRSSSIVCAG